MQKPLNHNALLGFGLPRALLLEMQQIREAFIASSFFLEPVPIAALAPVARNLLPSRRSSSLTRL